MRLRRLGLRQELALTLRSGRLRFALRTCGS
jgi:hypothetical protein